MLNRNELVNKYSELFWKFSFDDDCRFEYNNRIYNLSESKDLVMIIDESKQHKDYMVAKIANNILAVLEIQQEKVNYKHTPVLMHIELSSFCDCECIMCAHCYEKNTKSKYLGKNTFDELEKYFPTCRIIIINGYGEPFIHPEIERIISEFDKYGIKLLTTTNLQHLPISSLKNLNNVFQRINVSCDGATKKTYESIRRNAKFDVFKKNVSILKQNCPNVQLFMSVVSMRQNILEAVELVLMAKQLGFEEIRFGRLGTNDFIENEIDDLINYPNLAKYMFECACQEGKKVGIRVVTPIIMKDSDWDSQKVEEEKRKLLQIVFFKDDSYYYELEKKFKDLYGVALFEPHEYSIEGSISCQGICHWIGFGMYINVSGKVRPCSEIPYNRFQEKKEETIDFNYRELTEFRKKFISKKIPRACLDCAFIMSDEIGCLKVDIEEYKDYFEKKRGASYDS